MRRPSKSPPKDLMLDLLKKIFQEDLKKFIPHFEVREQQLIMSKKILESFLEDKKIIIEAPTGVGKSLGYLVAALVYLKEINPTAKFIVSTYTKTLQQQLIKKDLVILNSLSNNLYNEDIKFTYFFGSENYICLNRFYEFKTEFLSIEEVLTISEIEDWLKDTQSGSLEELELNNPEIWQEINRQIDLCRRTRCKFYEGCLYYKNLKQIKKSDIIVVNHHLFFLNLLYSDKIFTKDTQQQIIIFDEAHNLEEVILRWLGFEITNTQLKYLCNQIYNPQKNRGLIFKLKSLDENLKENLKRAVLNLIASTGQFFSELNLKIPQNLKEIRINKPYIVEDCLTPALKEVLSLLLSLRNLAKTEDEYFRINAFIKRTASFVSTLTNWIKCEDVNNNIYWVEKEETKKKKLKIALRITPLEIAESMQQKVFSVYEKIVFTSATIAINNNYEFFKKSVGLSPEIIPNTTCCESVSVSSPFDFKNNVLLFLPENIPNPKEEPDEYKFAILNVIKNLISLTEGNTFVLFTSFELMNWVYKNIQTNLKIFIQTESKYKLLEKYKSTENSVLFGVDTFWQGIDIPGEKLISIIIPKLPFDVPEHPIIEAKIQKLASEGKDPFKEYLLPNAIINLKQGFGRLIRRNSDWGIISILDPRIKTKWYGRYFLKALPECMITSSLEKVKEFFKERKKYIL
ncbi:MAG: ATP-dependent DNA helicase [Endomicrobiia bacterium]